MNYLTRIVAVLVLLLLPSAASAANRGWSETLGPSLVSQSSEFDNPAFEVMSDTRYTWTSGFRLGLHGVATLLEPGLGGVGDPLLPVAGGTLGYTTTGGRMIFSFDLGPTATIDFGDDVKWRAVRTNFEFVWSKAVLRIIADVGGGERAIAGVESKLMYRISSGGPGQSYGALGVGARWLNTSAAFEDEFYPMAAFQFYFY